MLLTVLLAAPASAARAADTAATDESAKDSSAAGSSSNKEAPTQNVLDPSFSLFGSYDIPLVDKYGEGGYNKQTPYSNALNVPKLSMDPSLIPKEVAQAQNEKLNQLREMLPEGYNGLDAFFVNKDGDTISLKDLQSGTANLSDVFRVCSSGSRSCSMAPVDQMLKTVEMMNQPMTGDCYPSCGQKTEGEKGGEQGGEQGENCASPGCVPNSPGEIAEKGMQYCNAMDVCVPITDEKTGEVTTLEADKATPEGLGKYLEENSPTDEEDDSNNKGTSEPPDRGFPDTRIGGNPSGSAAWSPGDAQLGDAQPSDTRAGPVNKRNAPENFWTKYAQSILSLLKMPGYDPAASSEISDDNRVWYARDKHLRVDSSLNAWSQLNRTADASKLSSAIPEGDPNETDVLGADQMATVIGQPYENSAVDRAPIPVTLKAKDNKAKDSTLLFGTSEVVPRGRH